MEGETPPAPPTTGGLPDASREQEQMPVPLLLGLLSGPPSPAMRGYHRAPVELRYHPMSQVDAMSAQMDAVSSQLEHVSAQVQPAPLAPQEHTGSACATTQAPASRVESACGRADSNASSSNQPTSRRPRSAPSARHGACATTSRCPGALPMGTTYDSCSMPKQTVTSAMHALDIELLRQWRRRSSATNLPSPSSKLPPRYRAAITYRGMSNGPLGTRAMLPTTLRAWDETLQQDEAVQRRLAPTQIAARPPPEELAAGLPSAYQVRCLV
ncbi:hypothetical protein AB1Y20_003407 [Prymnesium parvum]|uniref:Uncharacterized protein n=1 Tax=Prymnesium parvum TaxID=97485 RepID=A0AB34JC63_PRYPA